MESRSDYVNPGLLLWDPGVPLCETWSADVRPWSAGLPLVQEHLSSGLKLKVFGNALRCFL